MSDVFTCQLTFSEQFCPHLEDTDSFNVHAATCILLGDGTGAVVVIAQQGHCSLLSMDSHSDGSGLRHPNVSPPAVMSCLPALTNRHCNVQLYVLDVHALACHTIVLCINSRNKHAMHSSGLIYKRTSQGRGSPMKVLHGVSTEALSRVSDAPCAHIFLQ